jgi:TPR repeat protein
MSKLACVEAFGDELGARVGNFGGHFIKGCDAGSGVGCSSLAYAYDEEEGIAADAVLSVKAYRRGCTLESPNVCVDLATVYMLGTGGVTKDLKRATELFEAACKLDSSYADYVYGVRLSDGSLGAVDDERAAQLLKRACDAEEGDACTSLAELVEQGRAH